jgi:hypothetical protein
MEASTTPKKRFFSNATAVIEHKYCSQQHSRAPCRDENDDTRRVTNSGKIRDSIDMQNNVVTRREFEGGRAMKGAKIVLRRKSRNIKSKNTKDLEKKEPLTCNKHERRILIGVFPPSPSCAPLPKK